ACISDSSVALYSSPGSRRRTDKSMRPGHTTRPLASMIRFSCQPSGGLPTPTTLPAARYSVCTPSTLLRGSIRRPLRISIFIEKQERRGNRGHRGRREEHAGLLGSRLASFAKSLSLFSLCPLRPL